MCASKDLYNFCLLFNCTKIFYSHFVITLEQRTNLKFLVRLGKSPPEAFRMLQEVYQDVSMTRFSIFEWHKRFSDGLEEWKTIDKQDRGEWWARKRDDSMRSSSDCTDDSRQSKHQSKWCLENYHRKFGHAKICAKMVVRLLNDDQKERCTQLCQGIIERLEIEAHLLAKVDYR